MKSILLAGRDCPLSVPEGEIPPGGFSLMLSNDGDMPAADFEAIFAHINSKTACSWPSLPWTATGNIRLGQRLRSRKKRPPFPGRAGTTCNF